MSRLYHLYTKYNVSFEYIVDLNNSASSLISNQSTLLSNLSILPYTASIPTSIYKTVDKIIQDKQLHQKQTTQNSLLSNDSLDKIFTSYREKGRVYEADSDSSKNFMSRVQVKNQSLEQPEPNEGCTATVHGCLEIKPASVTNSPFHNTKSSQCWAQELSQVKLKSFSRSPIKSISDHHVRKQMTRLNERVTSKKQIAPSNQEPLRLFPTTYFATNSTMQQDKLAAINIRKSIEQLQEALNMAANQEVATLNMTANQEEVTTDNVKEVDHNVMWKYRGKLQELGSMFRNSEINLKNDAESFNNEKINEDNAEDNKLVAACYDYNVADNSSLIKQADEKICQEPSTSHAIILENKVSQLTEQFENFKTVATDYISSQPARHHLASWNKDIDSFKNIHSKHLFDYCDKNFVSRSAPAKAQSYFDLPQYTHANQEKGKLTQAYSAEKTCQVIFIVHIL